MNLARMGHSGMLLADGRLLVAGGQTSGSLIVSSAEILILVGIVELDHIDEPSSIASQRFAPRWRIPMRRFTKGGWTDNHRDGCSASVTLCRPHPTTLTSRSSCVE